MNDRAVPTDRPTWQDFRNLLSRLRKAEADREALRGRVTELEAHIQHAAQLEPTALAALHAMYVAYFGQEVTGARFRAAAMARAVFGQERGR